MKRLIVTGGGGSATTNFVKSLRMVKERFYIVGTDISKFHLELNDLLDARYILPRCDDPNYVKSLNRLIKKERIDMVHPQPDVEVRAISEQREKINALTYLPSKETVRTCQDKMETADIFERNKVPVAESYLINNLDDLKNAMETLLKKVPKVWLRAIKGAGSRAALPVDDLEQAKNWIEYWQKTKGVGFGQFMACELLPGKEFAWQSLWREGTLITSQARERQEYIFANLTASGQSSSPSKAMTVNRGDVNEIATKAVLAIDKKATGIFCLDMKENKDGVPCVTEINTGRFFTTSNFFSEAGSNMPYYYIKMAFGEKLPKLPQYNPIPAGWYWVRVIDMGEKLVRGEKWTSKTI